MTELEQTPDVRRLVVCYISGFDLRRVSEASTPFVARAMREYPWKRYTNLPSNELFPTLVTGVDPTVHGVWGVRLTPGPEPVRLSAAERLLPVSITTTIQCFRHFRDNTYDLAAIEPRRRQQFDITRTKYLRRNSRPEALLEIGGVPTVLGLSGNGGHYVYSSSADPVAEVLPLVCESDGAVEILELYSLDRYQQWNLDDIEAVGRFYGTIDRFLESLHRKCGDRDATLVLLSDHGHEPIVGSVDLERELEELGIADDDVSYFTEVSNVRFWFHSPAAAETVTHWLGEQPNGRLLGFREMAEYGVPLTDKSYGEYFYFLDPGYVFFPHDFYHPVANAFLGLSDPMQRKRLKDPRHRGNHGHLPESEAEDSFMLLLDAAYSPGVGDADILDVAPTILDLLRVDRPDHMSGTPMFEHEAHP